MPVVVVTDSAARIPGDIAVVHGIRIVPLHILVEGADILDGVDAVPPDIHDKHATTSAASPAEMLDIYRRALSDSAGAGVVAVHLSDALSGTFGAAELAAAELGDQVQVIDSRSAAMGTGFPALAAARVAGDGADLQTVAATARSAIARTHGFIVVQQLDNLRRSGRIAGAAAWLGTALSLKPLLRIDDGKLVLAQRVRTASKAVAAMIERVVDIVGDQEASGRGSLAVHHVANFSGAQEVADALAERLPECEPATINELGPVLALHVGAGALAVVVELADGSAPEPTGDRR